MKRKWKDRGEKTLERICGNVMERALRKLHRDRVALCFSSPVVIAGGALIALEYVIMR